MSFLQKGETPTSPLSFLKHDFWSTKIKLIQDVDAKIQINTSHLINYEAHFKLQCPDQVEDFLYKLQLIKVRQMICQSIHT